MKIILLVVVILIVIIGGYFLFKGGYQNPNPQPAVSPRATGGEAKEFNVSSAEFAFNPTTITVISGERVRIIFKNNGNFPHNWTVEGLGIATKTISAGQTDTIEFTAPAAGTYGIFCSVPTHQERGMAGTLKVESLNNE